jgi:NAD(P)-dependent dehydrogenase (short-subunit alcohol dehydrogenase family)
MSQSIDMAALFEPMFGLAGKVALVTGGAVGMGRAACLALAAAGARVILADDAERVEQLSGLGEMIEVIVLDVTHEASVEAALADITVRYGGLDVLVNGAVMNHNRPLLEISGDEWDRVQGVNLKGAFLVTKAAVPAMRARGGGRVINLSTMGSVHPVLNGNAAYSSSRAGLNQFTRNIALDFASENITANAILPGAIITETIKSGFVPSGPGANPARHLGGFGKPDDVTGLILLLAGPSGRFISGQCIAVDGGFLVS